MDLKDQFHIFSIDIRASHKFRVGLQEAVNDQQMLNSVPNLH